jgi:hypothetical protein
MDLILKNPYRVVGLLVGSTAKEQERQIKRLRKFIAADQVPEDDFSFPVLGSIHRSENSLDDAVSKLNLNNDKINASLFWFFSGNVITDEPAFNVLHQGEITEASTIWDKLVTEKEISSKNASAFFNLGTLYLISAYKNPSFKERHLEKGISLKLKFLESSFVNDLIKKSTDETFSISKKDLQLSFLNLLQTQVEKSKSLTENQFIDIIEKVNFSAKGEFLKSYSHKPIALIESKINQVRTKRKTSQTKAAEAGEELYYAVTSQLGRLKKILGSNDLRYSSISDKVLLFPLKSWTS